MLNKRERGEKNCMMSDLSSCQLFSASSLGQTHLIASHRAASQNSWEDPKIPANWSLSSIHENSFQYVKTWGGKLIRMKRRWVHMSLVRRQTTGIMFGIYSSLRDSGGYGGIYTSKQWFSCCAEVEHVSQIAFSYTHHRICLHETLPCENTQFLLYSNVHYFKNLGPDFIFGKKLILFSNETLYWSKVKVFV